MLRINEICFVALATIIQCLASGEVSGRSLESGPFQVKFASDLGFSMIGSIVTKNKNNVILLKSKATGKVMAHRVGYPVLDKYVVKEIHPDYIVLSEISLQGGKSFKVFKDGFVGAAMKRTVKAPAPAPVGISDSYSEEGFSREKGAIELTQAYREKKIIEDLPKILMQASAEPIIRNGEIQGFSLDQIDQDSIYAKAGLKNGDIVKSINDIVLDDVTATIKMLHSLKKSDSIHFIIERNGTKIPINISVK